MFVICWCVWEIALPMLWLGYHIIMLLGCLLCVRSSLCWHPKVLVLSSLERVTSITSCSSKFCTGQVQWCTTKLSAANTGFNCRSRLQWLLATIISLRRHRHNRYCLSRVNLQRPWAGHSTKLHCSSFILNTGSLTKKKQSLFSERRRAGWLPGPLLLVTKCNVEVGHSPLKFLRGGHPLQTCWKK